MFNKNEYLVSLEEVGVVPTSTIAYSNQDVNLGVNIGGLKLHIPIISAAMDSVTNTNVARIIYDAGGFGMLNLCGLISRYELCEYNKIYQKIVLSPTTKMLCSIYSQKIDFGILRHNFLLLSKNDNVHPVFGVSAIFGVSATPQYAEEMFNIAYDFHIDTFSIQASFISPNFEGGLNIIKYIKELHGRGCTVLVGNIASVETAKPFIDAGVDGIIEGIGPGSICSTRKVLGIGNGHITALSEISRYIIYSKSDTKLIADGGIHNSGDIVKLLCSGADAVMIGSLFARTADAPFLGFHWGMSSMDSILPRGELHKFDIDDDVNIRKVLFGPSNRDNGTLALVPAIRNAFANLGVRSIDEAYNNTKVVRFPGMLSEGKNK